MASFTHCLPVNPSQLHKDLVQLLVDTNQTHIFQQWTADDDASKVAFFEQLHQLDTQYPGGIANYVEQAKTLLQHAREGINPFLGCKPSPPAGISLSFASDKFFEAERVGLSAIGSSCFVLVAGGLGERLGYSGIKVALPCELASGTPYLKLYVDYILALQAQFNAQLPADAPPVCVPLVIMTSDDTHAKTVALLERHEQFGMAAGQVTILKQNKVASIANNDAQLAVEPDNPYKILTKPHGHGDVHLLLHQSGILDKWAAEGKDWVLFFQDTNAMSFRTMVAGLGTSVAEKFMVNSIAVPRKAKAAAGAIMRLEYQSGAVRTLNVEYNYVEDLLRASGSPEGDVNAPDGYSPFAGNTNQLIFSLASYVENLKRTKGLVPEFVNPKFTDETRTKFKKPTRLECMMQDYPQTLSSEVSVGVTIFHDQSFEAAITHRLYCPVKNNLEDAKKKAAAGIPDASAITGELSIYAANSCLLKSLGVKVQDPTTVTLGGITQSKWSQVVLSPSFAATYAQVLQRFPHPANVLISNKSSLLLDGDVCVESLELDGALTIRVCKGAQLVVRDVNVSNKGWVWENLQDDEESAPEILRMRGCRLTRRATAEFVVDTPGSFVLDGSGEVRQVA